MYINKAIRDLMKTKNVSLTTMAKALGKERGNEISSRLRSNNLSFNSAVEMLSALGYEVVIQERKPGVRRADQIVIDQKEDPKYDLVSAKDQSLARQLAALKAYAPDLDDDHIFTDKQSGKNFNRKQYIKLKSILLPGDEVLVEELDRLGRNKEEIKAELEWFKAHGVIVRVFDIPTTLIDFQGQDWVADMVNNILIEVLGAVAEQERKKIRKRQAEGIKAMPVVNGRRVSAKTGRGFGRPARELDMDEFKGLLQKQREGLITVRDACRQLGISRPTWYEKVRKVV